MDGVTGRIKVYWDFRDWWVGVFFDTYYLYICIIPCLVLRIRRRYRDEDIRMCRLIDLSMKMTAQELKDGAEYLESLRSLTIERKSSCCMDTSRSKKSR